MSVENAEHGGGGFAIDPMHQFEIKTLFPMQFGSIDASFTNSSLFMVIAAALLTLLMLVGINRRAMVPGRLQSIVELSYEFIANMLRDNVGSAGLRFFPFVFTLFMFILALNLLGMVPYAFTVTSHIIVTFALAFFIFIGVTILGFAVHGFGFFKFFVPHGVPAYLLPLVVPIEVVSYLTRPISLSVRLFANMMAGHTVLKVFAGFVIALGAFGYLPGLLPLAFMVALTGLEVLVAALQAYVFAILTCIYLNDALHMH
ncbi:F0F1 ATP synthase subunit A [Phenylobacterium sp.]|uniref:F0F1 ATP synthase subunit A n=3 Tax=Alphaproteobacteria TaxID=28211 RepID=UPI00273111C1|nr:F0F1 ATP synthase subunit A [Phenylobacterium sp.]MDP2213816.1 F0F1 ATP synthase subunit A [Phenylobacterium sp.]